MTVSLRQTSLAVAQMGYISDEGGMSKTVQIRARTDAETKEGAEKILEELGVSASAAINMFYRQIILRRGLPFPVESPNAETRAAIEQARSGEGVIAASDLQELLTVLVDADPRLLRAVEGVAKKKT